MIQSTQTRRFFSSDCERAKKVTVEKQLPWIQRDSGEFLLNPVVQFHSSCMNAKDSSFNNIQQLSDCKPAQVFRKPQRVSITIPQSVYEYLLKRSNQEGRSLSNLAANLLEIAAQEADL